MAFPRVLSPRSNAACSRRVTASSAPIDHPDGVRPVNFAAPRIAVFSGMSTYTPPSRRAAKRPCGERPMRRVLTIDRLETLEQKKQLRPPRPKYPAPSTKNGRRSSRKVSNADKFTTAGSTSTWPKSGLIVALSVRLEVSNTRASTPTRPSAKWGSSNGLLGSAGTLDDRPTTYGRTSALPGAPWIVSPVRCPKRDGPPDSVSPQNAHCEFSLSRFSWRHICRPQVCSWVVEG